MRDLPRLHVEALDRQVVVFVSAPRDDEVVVMRVGVVRLHVRELDRVDGRVDIVVAGCRAAVPSDLMHRFLQIAHVPDLDPLSHSASPSHHVPTIITHLNGVSADLGKAEGGCQFVAPDVPEFDGAVPTTCVELLVVFGEEFCDKDLVCVSGVIPFLELMDELHVLFVENFNTRLIPRTHQPRPIVRIPARLISLLHIHTDKLMRQRLPILNSPRKDPAICADADQFLRAVEHSLRFPAHGEYGERQVVILDVEHGGAVYWVKNFEVSVSKRNSDHGTIR